LALQNSVPRANVGAATAGRQFFQQLGGAVGVAVFGALLVSTVSSSMEHSLAPVRASMPPEFQSQLDPAKLRHGPGEGGGARVSVEQRITAQIHERFAKQRESAPPEMRP